MTVHDDLATLDSAIRPYDYDDAPYDTAEVLAARDRVKAEVARLREGHFEPGEIEKLRNEFKAAEAEKERWKAMSQFRRERQKQAEAENARLDRCLTLETERAVAAEGREFQVRADNARLGETLDAIEKELGTLPLDHLGPTAERSVSKAWAMAREKRLDPQVVPRVLADGSRALLADQDGAAKDCPNCGRRIRTQPCEACELPAEGGAS